MELTDTTIMSADLEALNSYTTGDIDAGKVAVMEGTAASLNNVYSGSASSSSSSSSSSDGVISGLGTEAVTVTDTTALTSELVILDENTNGVIDASAAHTLRGSVDSMNSVYGSDGFTGLGAEEVTLTDTELLDVATLNILNGYTTGNIDASELVV